MSRDRDLLLGTAAAVIAASMFATLGPLSRLSAEIGVGAFAFVAWRAFIGTIALGAGIAARGEHRRAIGALRSLPRRGQAGLLAASVARTANNLAIFLAFTRMPIAVTLLTFYTYPAMVVAVELLTGRERWSRPTMGALALASAGVVLMLAADLEPSGTAVIDPLGVLLALAAAVSQVVFVVVSRQSYAAAPADAATVVVLGVSAAGAAAAAILTGQADDLVVPLRTLDPWPYLLQAGVLAAGVSSYLFLVAIRRIGGTRTGILMLLEPVAGTILAAIVLGESIGALQVLGGGLVLAGAAVLQVRARPHREPIAEEGAAPVA